MLRRAKVTTKETKKSPRPWCQGTTPRTKETKVTKKLTSGLLGTAADVLAVCAQRGVVLSLDGDQPRYRASRGAMTPDLRAALAAHRDELRHLLALTPASPEYGAALVGV